MLILIYLMIAAGLIAGVVYLARLMTEEAEVIETVGGAMSTEEVSENNSEYPGHEGNRMYNLYEHGIPFSMYPLP